MTFYLKLAAALYSPKWKTLKWYSICDHCRICRYISAESYLLEAPVGRGVFDKSMDWSFEGRSSVGAFRSQTITNAQVRRMALFADFFMITWL